MGPVANVVIVPAHDEDIPAISGIYARRVRAGLVPFETEAPTPKELRRRRLELRSKHFPYLVAFYDNALVGYAYAGPYRDRLTVEDFVCIDPAYAGKGIGRALLDALIHESEVRGFRRMVAVIGDRASVRLHRRCGFTMVGAPRAAGGADGAIEPVLMQRPLGKTDVLSAVA